MSLHNFKPTFIASFNTGIVLTLNYVIWND